MFLRTLFISFATTVIVWTADLLLTVSTKQLLQYTSSIRKILRIYVSVAFSFCRTKCISLHVWSTVFCKWTEGIFFLLSKVLNNLIFLSVMSMIVAWLPKPQLTVLVQSSAIRRKNYKLTLHFLVWHSVLLSRLLFTHCWRCAGEFILKLKIQNILCTFKKKKMCMLWWLIEVYM